MSAAGENSPPRRPSVSAIVPFGGTSEELAAFARAFAPLRLEPRDELLVVDNSREGLAEHLVEGLRTICAGAAVVRAARERSSYYARNEGALAAEHEWLLFLDADCHPRADLIGRYFDPPPAAECGAIAGEVLGLEGQAGVLPRYAASRGYLRQDVSLALGPLAYAATANLLVRKRAWLDAGGFVEDARSGGDQDFCWRMRAAGWPIDHRPSATVEHEHRESIGDFMRLWAKYGRGRAWLDRRAPGAYSAPDPIQMLVRPVVAAVVRLAQGRPETAAFRCLDALAAAAETYGWSRSNRARRPVVSEPNAILVSAPSPKVKELAGRLEAPSSVQAGARARRPEPWLYRDLTIHYAEDDGLVRRLLALPAIAVRRPWRVLGDLVSRDALRRRALLRHAAQIRRLQLARRVVVAEEDDAPGLSFVGRHVR
jgi:hypothetical protein